MFGPTMPIDPLELICEDLSVGYFAHWHPGKRGGCNRKCQNCDNVYDLRRGFMTMRFSSPCLTTSNRYVHCTPVAHTYCISAHQCQMRIYGFIFSDLPDKFCSKKCDMCCRTIQAACSKRQIYELPGLASRFPVASSVWHPKTKSDQKWQRKREVVKMPPILLLCSLLICFVDFATTRLVIDESQ